MPPIAVERATPQDLDAMVALLHALFAIEVDFHVDADKQRRGLQQLLGRPDALVLVARDNGRCVAMCSVQTLMSTAEGGPVGLIEDVVVDTNYRGQGLGRQLMDAVEREARQRGYTRLQLVADRTNQSALDFYQRLGWSQTRLLALHKLLR